MCEQPGQNGKPNPEIISMNYGINDNRYLVFGNILDSQPGQEKAKPKEYEKFKCGKNMLLHCEIGKTRM